MRKHPAQGPQALGTDVQAARALQTRGHGCRRLYSTVPARVAWYSIRKTAATMAPRLRRRRRRPARHPFWRPRATRRSADPPSRQRAAPQHGVPGGAGRRRTLRRQVTGRPAPLRPRPAQPHYALDRNHHTQRRSVYGGHFPAVCAAAGTTARLHTSHRSPAPESAAARARRAHTAQEQLAMRPSATPGGRR